MAQPKRFSRFLSRCSRLTAGASLIAPFIVLLSACNHHPDTLHQDITSIEVQQNGQNVSTIDLGDVPVGQVASQQASVIFTSFGSQLAISDPSGDFSQQNDCPTASANGGRNSTTCTLTVSAFPSAPGPVTATVNLVLNSGHKVTLMLKANGVAAAGPVLSITKVANPTTYTANGSVSFTITVTNRGNAATSGTITVTDVLNVALTPFPLVAMNWTCNNPTTAGATVTCSRGDALAPGASYDVIIIQADVAGSPPSITNTANISGGGAPNSSGSATVTLQ